MMPLVPEPAEIVVDTLENGCNQIALGKKLFAIWTGDNQAKADSIRATCKKIGSGLCAKQNRVVDLFFSTAENKLYGLSTYRGDRWFKIQERPI
jgi:hypothetical protein